MWLDTLTIHNYRCFQAPDSFGGFGKINIFIGKNNSGKSHLIKAIYRFGDWLNRSGEPAKWFTKQDYYKEHEGLDLNLKFIWKITPEFIQHLIDEGRNDLRGHLGLFDVIRNENNKIKAGAYIIIEVTQRGMALKMDDSIRLTNNRIMDLYREEGHRSISVNETVSRNIIEFGNQYLHGEFRGNFFRFPDLRLVQKGTASAENKFIYTPDGTNLIKELYDLERPLFQDKDREIKRNKFEAIKRFLKELLEDDSIDIQPNPIDTDPTGGQIVIESTDENPYIREIRDLGYGITELILFATGVSHLNRGIIVVEEPENHLHPEAVKKLIKYITRPEDKNQYFIATHSNVFLDFTPDIRIFRVTHDGEKSSVFKIEKYDEVFATLSAIGYKPSDIVQSNFVIWVEGPSDRIYIKRWFDLYLEHEKTNIFQGTPENIDLKEGLHYSFAAYGGSCLSHFAVNDAQDQETTQPENVFANLLNLSRNCAVVMDSDLKGNGDSINSTKERVKAETEDAGRICWITWGRTIEGYISNTVYGTINTGKRNSRFRRALDPRIKLAQKMRKIMSYESEFVAPKGDLSVQIKKILIAIGKANGFIIKADT